MDQRIYGRLNRADLGVYGTRRYPKGVNIPLSIPQGPTQPTDPNSNPAGVQRHFSSSGIAPHAQTMRWEYIVPPRRRAVIQSVYVKVMREVAAAPSVGYRANVSLIRAADLAQGVFTYLAQAHGASNNVGDPVVEFPNSGPVEMFEGDILRGHTEDISTGGQISYAVSATIIEYDATHRVTISSAGNNSGLDSLGGAGTRGGSSFSLPSGGVSLWPLQPERNR